METIRITHAGTVSTIKAKSAHLNGVRALPVDGMITAVVRETFDDERELVVNARYAATWLGWHRGQCPAYGDTVEQAVRRLAAGKVA